MKKASRCNKGAKVKLFLCVGGGANPSLKPTRILRSAYLVR